MKSEVDPTANGGQGGYLIAPDGQPVEFHEQLFAGQEIDRFGSEFGSFLAPSCPARRAR